ncbi:MAG: cold shock domain-containing protein [candidate division WOR-3 bacterium]
MEFVGRVKWFDTKKGYGFIEAPDGGDDVFVHSSDVLLQGRPLEPDEMVKFELGSTPHGRRALRVRRESSATESPGR